MKQKFEKSFVLIPIGLCWNSTVLAISHFKTMPDLVTGILTGVGIGLMVLPFIFKKFKPTSC